MRWARIQFLKTIEAEPIHAARPSRTHSPGSCASRGRSRVLMEKDPAISNYAMKTAANLMSRAKAASMCESARNDTEKQRLQHDEWIWG